MATHEQLPSTSSRPALDPTTTTTLSSVPHTTIADSEGNAVLSTVTKQRSDEAGNSTSTINIGTRRSALAVIQAEMVLAALKASHPETNYEIHAMSTMGDKNQVTALHEFGAKSLWTHELEAQLLEGKLDCIVHCLKDMPTQLPKGCEIGVIMEREDPRDIVVMKQSLLGKYKMLKDLPDGSVVGTSSVRRSAQIKRLYPGLKFKDVRGNVGTRLAKLDAEDGEYSCLILAAAGILRMGWKDRITQYLDSNTEGGGMLHAVGQGALAIEVRKGDTKTMAVLSDLENMDSTLAGTAERSLMRTLEGGCSVPIGVETSWTGGGKEERSAKKQLLMKALVVSLDGSKSVAAEKEAEITDVKAAEEFGWTLAQELVKGGAGKILEEINLNRPIIEEGGNA